MLQEEKLRSSIQEVILLSMFKSFCEKNSSVPSQQRLRNIYQYSPNPIETTRNLIINELGERVSIDDATKLYPLLLAFLKKKPIRKTIADNEKHNLLKKQGNKCSICGKPIDIHAHADHIVPFKYVGDELEDNLQMLCSDCNLKKNASIDYQIRFLLKSI